MFVKRIKIRKYEKGFLFHDKQIKRILEEGIYWFWGWMFNVKVRVLTTVTARIDIPDLEMIIKSELLDTSAEIVNLSDSQVALVWIDNRLSDVLTSGVYAYWKEFHKIKIEILEVTAKEIIHEKISVLQQSLKFNSLIHQYMISDGCQGILSLDGKIVEVLEPGLHLYWKSVGSFSLVTVDKHDTKIEINGQELLTLDKVTLRINAMVSLKVVDSLKAVTAVDDYTQAIYKEAQLVLRETVGQFDLESLLVEKDSISQEMKQSLAKSTSDLGLQIVSLRIKDIILPGDMKELMNKVVEAKKTSEANLIVRREETASLRSQLNSAKILESSPVLMKLKELEVLERIAGSSDLKVILGDEGLKDKIMKLI